MSAEQIIAKIKEKANNEASDILDSGRKKAQESVLKINKQIDNKLKEIEQKSIADNNEVVRRSELMMRLDTRKMVLTTKRDIIDEAFEKVKNELYSFDDIRWANLITRVVVKASETGDEKLRVPSRDLEKYTKDFLGNGTMLSQLNKALVSAGKKGNLVLDDVPADFGAGVMLVREKSDINCSFDIILESIRNQCEREVADILFDKEV